MVLHVFTSFLGGVPLCIPYGLYSGTSLGGTTREILRGFPGRVLSAITNQDLISSNVDLHASPNSNFTSFSISLHNGLEIF